MNGGWDSGWDVDWRTVGTILGAIITVAGSYVVARIGGKVSKHATDTTAQVTKEANAVEGFHELVGDLQSDLRRLREDHETLHREHNDLKRHVEVLERERSKYRRTIRQLIAYAKQLRAALVSSGTPVPPPPPELDLESYYP